MQILDNKYPALFKTYFIKNDIKYQLVLPNLHRNIAAEKAIGMLKDHLTTILCSFDHYFPMHL